MSGYLTHWPVDLRSDDSITVYVWPDQSLSDTKYIPKYLIDIKQSDYVTTTRPMQLRRDAYLAMYKMALQLYADTGLPLHIVSAYRSHSYQSTLYHLLANPNLSARAWHSEHQLGLAIDVYGLSNATFTNDTDASIIYARLKQYAHHYGRHESYQKGLEIDGYHPEKRHRRYLGTPLATWLYHHDQTFTEYYYDYIKTQDPQTNIRTSKPYRFSSRTYVAPASYKPATPLIPSSEPTLQEQLWMRPL
jgi:hypothetical protein